ncbi:MAG: flagellar basal body rod protein FlgB [Gammaproteobacteria bacterium]
MPISLDSALGIHAQALQLRSRRAELLAENIANADTPGYKARDIDFKQALGAAQQGAALKLTQPDHIQPASIAGIDGVQTGYRNPLQPSLDGNTVDMQVEQAAFARNAVDYQTSLTFLSGRIRTLLTAIKGE